MDILKSTLIWNIGGGGGGVIIYTLWWCNTMYICLRATIICGYDFQNW